MSKQVQYIHCPKCNGIIKHEKEELGMSGFYDSIRVPHSYPKCSECNTEWIIEVATLGTMKITLREAY